jgi:signal peptidase II
MNEVEREGAAVPPPPAEREGAAVPPRPEVRRGDAPKRMLPAVVSGWRWLPLSVAVIVADRIVKLWMIHHFAPLERVHVLRVLDIILTYNTGAAFSFLADASGWQRWLFVLLALGVSAALIVWMRRLDARLHGLLACGLALIVGGALGNMIDRIATGRVVDFIHVHWGAHYFPAFNIADSAITIGAALLLLDAWHESRRARRLRI